MTKTTITLRKLRTWPRDQRSSQEQFELQANEKVVGMNTVAYDGIYYTVFAIETSEEE